MKPERTNGGDEAYLALGIFAWNEQDAIRPTLESLFGQSLFPELNQRNLRCEIYCVLNGCTDRTAAVAAEVLEQEKREHPHAAVFSGRVVNLAERGKMNAWNQFVHSVSPSAARFLVMMDADILMHQPTTVWNMVQALEKDPLANVAIDRPCKDLLFKKHKSLRERLSLRVADTTLSAEAQLCAQLYCIRSEVARNIYLPKDISACEDGLIKALVCTDFLSHAPMPERVRLAEGAGHTFEAYTSPAAIFRNQKRQIIGQTIVHILVDQYLSTLPAPQKQLMADTLRSKDAADPNWLKRLISEHLERTPFCWRLYPGLLSLRFKRLAKLRPIKRLACFPAALAASAATLLASFAAYRFLKQGSTDYWPRAKRVGLLREQPQLPTI
jgi:hypothetical protein